jgi:hypothetical protein
MNTIPPTTEQQLDKQIAEWKQKFPMLQPYYMLEFSHYHDGYEYINRYDATDPKGCYRRLTELHPDFKFVGLRIVAKTRGVGHLVSNIREVNKAAKISRYFPIIHLPISATTIALTL